MKYTKLIFVLAIFFAYNLCFAAPTEWIPIKPDQTTESKITYKENQNGISLQFQINGYKLVKTLTPNDIEFIPQIPDGSKMQKSGAPDLPSLSKSIIIPDNEDYKFTVISSEFIDIENTNIAPSKGIFNRTINPETIPYEYGEEYNQNSFFPGKLVQAGNPYIMRDFRGQAITVYPVQYNPVTKTLRVYTSINISINKIATKNINVINRTSTPAVINEIFQSVYKNHFINFTDINSSKYTPIAETGNMLIICHGAFMDAMQPFVLWKKQKGIPVEMVDVSTIGNNASAIKTYVTNYYNQNGLAYLLLVGDHAQVNTSSTSAGDSDQDYGYLLGSDHYSDILVGRFSAETVTHVQVQAEKVITYERDLDNADTWLNIATGIASDEGGNGAGDLGESDIVHMNFIRDTLLNYGYASVDQIYDPGASASTLSNVINAGRGIIDYVGHGSDDSFVTTGFNNTNVNQLNNIDKLPYIFSVACVNGNFKNQTCFGEAWLRANISGKPIGAVAVLMSTINQSWNSPMCGQDEMVRLVTHTQGTHQKQTYGGISVNGLAKMIDNYAEDGENMADTWTCFGDPSLIIRTKTPQEMVVSHAPVTFIGSTQFTVNCDNDDALVCLSLNGEILAMANFSFPALTQPDTLVVTATAQDYVTYIGNVLIVPNVGAYVVCNSQLIDDSNGNNNNTAEYNENITLNITLKNVGVVASQNVVAVLSSSSPYITITQNQHSCGNINADETILFNNAFTFTVADVIPNNNNVMFQLILTDANDSIWTSNFLVPIYSPVFNIGFNNVDDSNGNNNHYLDPGETNNLLMSFRNNSISASTTAYCILTSSNNLITINTDSLNLGVLGANSNNPGSFNITVDPSALPASYADFTFHLYAGSYDETFTMSLPIGLTMEDWESAGFSTFSWESAGNLPWVIDSAEKYEGDYSAKSGSIPNSQSAQDNTSELFLTLNVLMNDSISFYKKVSSEQDYDFLRFFIDDVQQSEWSGEVAWSRSAYPVTSGIHEFKWVYSKDYYATGGSDAAWVDAVILPAADMGTKVQVSTKENSAFNVYPNPVKSGQQINFNISSQDIEDNYLIEIFDVTGRKISSLQANNKQASNCSNLQSGLYFFTLLKNGKFESCKRVVIAD